LTLTILPKTNRNYIISKQVDINIINNINDLQVKRLEEPTLETRITKAKHEASKLKKSARLNDAKSKNQQEDNYKKEQELVIVSANVNGLQIETTDKLNHILEWMEKENINILLSQENNTNMEQHFVAQKIATKL
jgi:hypothetical protein